MDLLAFDNYQWCADDSIFRLAQRNIRACITSAQNETIATRNRKPGASIQTRHWTTAKGFFHSRHHSTHEDAYNVTHCVPAVLECFDCVFLPLLAVHDIHLRV